jgi:hypothetical protein
MGQWFIMTQEPLFLAGIIGVLLLLVFEEASWRVAY